MPAEHSFDRYRMPDALWENLWKLLPVYKVIPSGGTPRRNFRSIADAIFYRLRTGCQWKAIPRSLPPGSTAHDYFKEWVRLGVFGQLWQLALAHYDELVGLDWRWQSVDAAMTKSPLGGEMTGKNPTDRGKQGTKRSIIADAVGIPLCLVISGANTHDIHLLEGTLEDGLKRSPRSQSQTTPSRKEHLCLDKGYDSLRVREMVSRMYGYVPHVRSRGEERKQKHRRKARRWVVERTHGWLNRFRGLIIRWDKKSANHLACAYITLKQYAVFG
ncbi:IS5 family transposase [Planctopirus hydrillae]|uniref:IS5 family transposase n=1 Tax=Planctopirus hydrillae TaxID=1841610 RepID=UPI000DA167A9|nr:IS5 family transposase [Planctopirus hydrillae]